MTLRTFYVASAVLLLSACGTLGGTKQAINDGERHTSARLALLCADVMDTFQANRSNPTPPVLNTKYSGLAQDWVVDGYIVGEDRTLAQVLKNEGSGTDRVMYGVLAHAKAKPDHYVVAIRGTGTTKEWKQDTWFPSIPDRWNDAHGEVEAGFFSIYKTFKYYPAAGGAAPVEAWLGIKNVIGNNPVTITGHSLGSPLATYLSFDLIERGGVKNLSGRYFASPRPGNGTFGDAFDKAIEGSGSNYVVYNYEEDAVPHTPPSILGFFYQHLSNVVTLDESNAQAKIRPATKTDFGCSHHVVSYAAMLDVHLLPDLGAWKQRFKDNGNSDGCI